MTDDTRVATDRAFRIVVENPDEPRLEYEMCAVGDGVIEG